MKHEKPLSERMYGDEVYTEIVRIIRYEGCLYRDLWTKLKPLADRFGQARVETATAHLLTYDRQFTVNPPPLAQVMLRAEARKLACGLLGLPPEHPWAEVVRQNPAPVGDAGTEGRGEARRAAAGETEADQKKEGEVRLGRPPQALTLGALSRRTNATYSVIGTVKYLFRFDHPKAAVGFRIDCHAVGRHQRLVSGNPPKCALGRVATVRMEFRHLDDLDLFASR